MSASASGEGMADGTGNPLKKTLSDSEVLAYNKNRFADRSLRHTVRKLHNQEQVCQDQYQRETHRWRDFMKRSARTTGTWCASPQPGGPQREGRGSQGGPPGMGDGPGSRKSSKANMNGALAIARLLIFQTDALNRLQKPWAYTFRDNSHNQAYNQAEELGRGLERRLFLRRATSASLHLSSLTTSAVLSSTSSTSSSSSSACSPERLKSRSPVQTARRTTLKRGFSMRQDRMTSAPGYRLSASPRPQTARPATATATVEDSSRAIIHTDAAREPTPASAARTVKSVSARGSQSTAPKSESCARSAPGVKVIERPKASVKAKLTASLSSSNLSKKRPQTSPGMVRVQNNNQPKTLPQHDHDDASADQVSETSDFYSATDTTMQSPEQPPARRQRVLVDSDIQGFSTEHGDRRQLDKNIPRNGSSRETVSMTSFLYADAEESRSEEMILPVSKLSVNTSRAPRRERQLNVVQVGYRSWQEAKDPVNETISAAAAAATDGRLRKRGVVIFRTSQAANSKMGETALGSAQNPSGQPAANASDRSPTASPDSDSVYTVTESDDDDSHVDISDDDTLVDHDVPQLPANVTEARTGRKTIRGDRETHSSNEGLSPLPPERRSKRPPKRKESIQETIEGQADLPAEANNRFSAQTAQEPMTPDKASCNPKEDLPRLRQTACVMPGKDESEKNSLGVDNKDSSVRRGVGTRDVVRENPSSSTDHTAQASDGGHKDSSTDNRGTRRTFSRRGSDFTLARSVAFAGQGPEVIKGGDPAAALRGALTRRCSAIDIRRRGSILKFVDNLEALRELTLGRMNHIADVDNDNDDDDDDLKEDELGPSVPGPPQLNGVTTSEVSGWSSNIPERPQSLAAARAPSSRALQVEDRGQGRSRPGLPNNVDPVGIAKSLAHDTSPSPVGQSPTAARDDSRDSPRSLPTEAALSPKGNNSAPARPSTAPALDDLPLLADETQRSQELRDLFPGHAGRTFASPFSPFGGGEDGGYTTFKGFRIWNYVPPQERYREERFLSSGRQARSLLRLAVDNPQCLQETPREELFRRPPLLFPKSARHKVMQELVQRNHQPTKADEAGVVPPELRAKIEEFFKSIQPYIPRKGLTLPD